MKDRWHGSSLEDRLRGQIGECVGVEPARLQLDRPLITLGLDSMAAVRLSHFLETDLGVALSSVHLLEECTLGGLLAQAEAARRRPLTRQRLPRSSGNGDLAPLSYGQQALWFLQRLAPAGSAYNVAVAARVRRGVDVEALRRAVAGLVKAHPALRTTFVERAGEPWQVIQAEGADDLVRVETGEETAEVLRDRLEREACRPFDLAREPLLRVLVWRLPDETVVQLVVHHIVVDFWSLSILAGDLGSFYAAAAAGRPCPAPRSRATYVDFVHWQRRLLTGERKERLRAYWLQTLTPLPPAIALPLDRRRGPVRSFAGASLTFTLETAVAERVHALAAARAVTAYTVLLAVFQALLARLSGNLSLLVGSPAAGRTAAAFAETVGYFVNPVVLRVDLSGHPTFEAHLGRTQAAVAAALEHQEYPFLLVAKDLEEGRQPEGPPGFQVMFALQQARHQREHALTAFACGQEGVRVHLGGLELESMSIRERTSQTDLSLALAEVGGRLCGQLRYDTDLFDDSTAHRLSGYFRTLLAAALAEPGRRVDELSVLTAEERRQLSRGARRRRAPAWTPESLPAGVAAAARRRPGATAAVGPAGSELRYGELNDRADRVAAGLRALGVGPEVLAAVMLERSPELLVAVLGILRAGGACLLLDPDAERPWLERLLERSGCAVVLTREGLVRRLPEHGAAEALLEHLEENAEDRAAARREIELESLAFVVQSAGADRQPRLVGLPHRSLAAWMEAWAECLAPEDLRVAAGEGMSATVDGVFDLMLALGLGGCVVLDRAADEVSLRSATPSLLAADLRTGKAGRARTIRAFGGTLGASLRARLLASGVGRVFDGISSALGGVWPRAETMDAYVLDRSGEPAPIGVAGELWLGGAGLARGYQAGADETAGDFRPDAFGGVPGGRLARTGDRARWRADGRLEILGTLGRELVTHGHRLDPGPAAEVLAEHPEVLWAVADLQGEGDGARLVAHVLRAAPDGTTAEELREFLRGRLPQSQVPWSVVVLDELPRTTHGRVDPRALPRAADPGAPDGDGPQTESERLLVEIWRELLRVDNLGIHDNFFHLGGNSLLATRAVARINEAFQLRLGVEALFRNPTIAGLALTTDEQLIAGLGEEALERL